MALVQPTLDIPDEIALKIATGEYLREGSVVRDLAGQIVKHLKEARLPDESAASESLRSAVAKVVKNPKTAVFTLGSVAVASVVGGVVIYVRSRRNAQQASVVPACVSEYAESLGDYLEAAQGGGRLDVGVMCPGHASCRRSVTLQEPPRRRMNGECPSARPTSRRSGSWATLTTEQRLITKECASVPKEKMWVHTDKGASLSASHKTEGHKSALARDKDNNLSQATMSEITQNEKLKEIAGWVGLGVAVGAVVTGLVWSGVEAWKRREARKKQAAEAAAALTEAQDDVDALIEDTYAVIEDSKTAQQATPHPASTEEDRDEDERQAFAKRVMRRRTR